MSDRLRYLEIAVLVHVVLTWLGAIVRGNRARRRPASAVPTRSCPAVSVLVPAWRERGTVERCIRSLRAVNYPSWEVVVVAGGSDGTYDAAVAAIDGDERFVVLEQQPRGKNAALNQAMVAAHHDVLVFLDADSEVEPDWLTELVTPLVSGVAAAQGNYSPRRRSWVSAVEQIEKIQSYGVRQSTSLQESGSVAIRRSAIERIGGLPEHIRVGVDWDLGVRLADVGETIAFARNARLITDRPATPREFWRNEVRWRRAHLRALWRRRRLLAKEPVHMLVGAYLYGLSVAVVLTVLAGTLVALISPSRRRAVLKSAGVGCFWLLGRRASPAFEVAAYDGDVGWLRFAWAPPLLLLPTIAASAVACLTAHRDQIWFQGPRKS